MSFLRKLLGTAAPIVGGAIGGPIGGAIGSAAGKVISGSSNLKKSNQGVQTASVGPSINQLPAQAPPPMSAGSLNEARTQDKTRMRKQYGIY
jgi:hypothetical protein